MASSNSIFAGVRRAQASDLSQAARLSRSVGFNQTLADWEWFRALSSKGVFVIEDNGRIVATSIGFPFNQSCGWVGMVVVDPEYRNRGLGHVVASAAVDYLMEQGCDRIGLDARIGAVSIYKKLGFREAHLIERWESKGDLLVSAVGTPIRDFHSGDLQQVCELDSKAFGAERHFALGSLLASPAVTGTVQECGGKVQGFAVARQGVGPIAVGPLVAQDSDGFKQQLTKLFEVHFGQSMAINVVPCAESSFVLQKLGFQLLFNFKRMFLGNWPTRGTDLRYFATMGPELG